jgi:SAM-dependent methyltransferase
MTERKSDKDKALFAAYQKHYKRMGNNLPTLDITPETLLDSVKPWVHLLPKDAQILDVGCGYGHQLYALHMQGFRKLEGIEISEGSFAIAQQEVGSVSQLHKVDAFEFLPRHPNHYDLIVLFDVLEHIPREETLEMLSTIYNALKPGGVFTVRVPNMASLLADYSMHLDFTHQVGFTEFSLIQVLDQVGFTQHKIVRHKPKLGIGNRTPPKVFYQVLKLVRYWANELLHLGLYTLRGQKPMPSTFDMNLEMYTQKPQ